MGTTGVSKSENSTGSKILSFTCWLISFSTRSLGAKGMGQTLQNLGCALSLRYNFAVIPVIFPISSLNRSLCLFRISSRGPATLYNLCQSNCKWRYQFCPKGLDPSPVTIINVRCNFWSWYLIFTSITSLVYVCNLAIACFIGGVHDLGLMVS